jgi:hypothetical protein
MGGELSQYFCTSAFQILKYVAEEQLQQIEWVFFLGLLMAVMDMNVSFT